MMLLGLVSGTPVFMGNPARITGRSLVLAHCTAPIAAGVSYSLHTHFESGMGVGVSVVYPRGAKVTLARLSPSLDLLRAFTGVVEESGLLSRLHCRTQVKVRVDVDAASILYRSIGNHYTLTLGDHLEALRYAAALLGAKLDTLQQ
jgi:L-fucose isomerase-like protein